MRLRFAFVHRKVKAVQCYLTLLVWLIVASVGFYWYLNRNGTGTNTYQQQGKENGRLIADAKLSTSSHNSQISSDKGKLNAVAISDPIQRLCNNPNVISSKDENANVPGYKLEGIIIVLRHGDRGPLVNVGSYNITHIRCHSDHPEFQDLEKFGSDTVLKLPGYSQFIGPFHSFAKVPASPYCSLGQLSPLGSTQLLVLGKLIRSIYKSTLTGSNHGNNSDEQSHPFKVVAYSTRYRRTFQSLFAFLFGLLGPKQLIQSTTLYESQSITFCFKHCSCKAVDRLRKVSYKKMKQKSEDKELMAQLVNQMNFVMGTEKSKKAGSSLLDALLVYPCHNAELPCYRDSSSVNRIQQFFSMIKNLAFKNEEVSKQCVTPKEFRSLIHLLNQEAEALKEVEENKKYHMLNSFGLLKEIVNLSLRMTSSFAYVGRRQQQALPISSMSKNFFTSSSRNIFRIAGLKQSGTPEKMAVFSGHDVTLQALTAALGIIKGHSDIHLPPFGSRLIFELYKKPEAEKKGTNELYFRLIFNGLDITHLISFCKREGKNTTEKTENQKILFCPMELLVKFVHENYFINFDNATNFKDACRKFA